MKKDIQITQSSLAMKKWEENIASLHCGAYDEIVT
jgi:hypothetical protein